LGNIRINVSIILKSDVKDMGRRHIAEERIVYSHRSKNMSLDKEHSPVQLVRHTPTNANE